MIKITKKELLEDANNYYGVKIPTDTILQNYIAIGLIKRLDFGPEEGTRGSVSNFPKNTPGMLYLIDVFKNGSFELKEIKRYLDLLKLDNPEEIKQIKTEDDNYRENRLFTEDITSETRNFLLYKVPVKFLNLKKFSLTKFKKFIRVIELRAYAELDYKEITDLIIKTYKDLKAFNDFQEVLNNPEINLNLDIDIPEIRVNYKDPINKTVLFTKDGVIII